MSEGLKFNEPKAKNLNKFSLYLEGARVPFNTIQITETEGIPSNAAVTFPSGAGALRVLPGTIVQMFSKVLDREGLEEEILIFEGEVTSLSYQKDSTQRICTLQCASLMQTMLEAKKSPKDSLYTQEYNNRIGADTEIPITIDGTINGPLTNNQLELLNELNLTKQEIVQLKNMAFSEYTGFSSYLTGAMQRSDFSAGDFQDFIEQIENFYELHDSYYGIQSQSFKLKASMFAFPNTNMSTGFNTPIMEQAIRDLQNYSGGFGGEQGTSLWRMVQSFLDAVRYRMLFPSSFTEARMFYNSNGIATRKPIRAIIAPDMENAPPAWCNVVFPDQVAGFGYTRNYKAEPTRAIGSVVRRETQDTSLAGLGAFYVVPHMQSSLADDPTDTGVNRNEKKLMTKFTTEECYRGVNPIRTKINGSLLDAIVHHAENNGADLTDKANWEKDSEYNAMLKHETLKQFVAARGAAQSFQMTTEWCPYRFVGLPGVMMDLRGPSIVGVLSSISTVISADGTAQQTLTFRNPRIVYDNEFSIEGDSPFTQVTDQTQKKYLINDFSSFGMLSTNDFFYDPSMYSFANIGMDVYSYLLWGTHHKRKQWKKLKEDNPDLFKKDNSTGREFEADIDQFYNDAPQLRKSDTSILSVLRSNTATDAQNGIAGAKEHAIELPEGFIDPDNDSEEIKNAKMVYLAIQKIKDQYVKKGGAKNLNDLGNFHSTKDLNDYTRNLNYRTIIKKFDYLRFIGASNTGHIGSNSYKDVISMVLDDPEFTVAQFKAVISGDQASSELATDSNDLEEEYNAAYDAWKAKAQEAYKMTQPKFRVAKEAEFFRLLEQRLESEIDSGEIELDGTWTNWSMFDAGDPEYTREEWKKINSARAKEMMAAFIRELTKEVDALERTRDQKKAKWQDAVANIDEVEEEIKKIDGALFKCYNINRLYHIQKSFNVLEEGIADKIQEKGLNPPIPEGSVGNIVLNE